METMFLNILLTCSLVGQLTASNSGTTAVIEQKTARSIGQIRTDINDSLQAESLADTTSERVVQIRRLVALHNEITSDARFTDSEIMQSLRTHVWARLIKVRNEAQRKLAIAEKQKPTAKKHSSLNTTQNTVDYYVTSNQLLLGPNGLLARGGGAVSDDLGEELIQLIQHTINPASWNVNGGTSSIYYYRPVMALVVRASSEVHENLGNGLNALRAAGR
jgi:uncharacterized phage infection (PIP) family protein YhgE